MPDKELYIEKHQAKMNQWEAELEGLKAKAAETSADFKIEFQKRAERLQSMMAAQRKRLGEISQSSEAAWKELKNGFDATFKELETTWTKTVSAFQ